MMVAEKKLPVRARKTVAFTSAETYRALNERAESLAQRNNEFGERIEQQAATIDVLRAV
jgi:hypothetical protein